MSEESAAGPSPALDRRFRPNTTQILILAATLCVTALIILSILRVSDRAVALSASVTALLAVTSDIAVSEQDIVLSSISIGDARVVSSDGDTRALHTNASGTLSMKRGTSELTLSSLTIPRDWLVYVDKEGLPGALRITARPVSGANPESRVELSMLIPQGAAIHFETAAGSVAATPIDRITQVELDTRTLDVSLKLKQADADIFTNLPVRTLSLQRILRRFDSASGQDQESYAGSVRQGHLWVEDDGQSPRLLTPIDRIRLGQLKNALLNLRSGDRLADVTLRGRAAEITNSLGDIASDLRPSRLSVLAQDELLKLLFALFAFVAGLEISWSQRR